MLTPQMQQYILSLKDEDINKNLIYSLFSRKIVKDGTGKITKMIDAEYLPYDVIIIEKGSLPNVYEKQDTTLGIYLFNMFCIVGCFGNLIPYQNKTFRNDDLGTLSGMMMNLILEQKATTEQFGKYLERVTWLNNFTEILMPGMSLNLITPSEKIMKLKAQLIEENKEAIKNNDYVTFVNNVETPLLKAAEEELKNDPGWPIYDLKGKPKFGNNYKNTELTMGPLKDPISGEFKISTASLMEGIPPEEYDTYANTAIAGAYSRGVATQDGGAKTKYLFAAMQSLILDPPGSDCGSKLLKAVNITKDNYRSYMYRNIVENGKLVMLTLENIKDYVDSTVKMRSPLYCNSDNICQVCAGDLFKRINIVNVGLTVTKITATLLNMSLKKMHDTSVKTVTFDPFDYITKV